MNLTEYLTERQKKKQQQLLDEQQKSTLATENEQTVAPKASQQLEKTPNASAKKLEVIDKTQSERIDNQSTQTETKPEIKTETNNDVRKLETDQTKSITGSQYNGGVEKSEQEKQAQKELEDLFLSGGKEHQLSATEKFPVVVPEYEQLEYVAPTDEQLGEQAKTNLASYEHASIKKIEEDSQNAKQKAQSEREDYERAQKGAIDDINALYDKARQSIDDDMLKRGLARSSTALLKGASTENERAKTLADYNAQYQLALDKFDQEIASAEQKRLQAINNFNIEYAVKYAEEVSRLKQERDEKVAEIIKFNNDVKEQAYSDKMQGMGVQIDLFKENMKYADIDGKYKNIQAQKAKLDQRLYEVLRMQLANLSKSEAQKLLDSDDELMQELSAYYYVKLREEFGE